MEGRGGEGKKEEGEQGWSTARTAWKNVVNRGKGAGGGGGGEREGKGGRGRERREVAGRRSEKKRKKKKAYDSPASGREPSVFAGAETGAEQTGGEEKHTHIVLCVVVGDFIILQTSRTETQTFFFFSFLVAALTLSHARTHTHTPSGNAPVSKLVCCARV